MGQTASFTTSLTSGCSPLITSFDASASSGTAPLIYHWDFGNSNTTTGNDKQKTDAIYITPGVFTVSLVVEDANGNLSAPATETITVFNSPTANFSILNGNKGCATHTSNFQDLSVAGDALLTKWTWGFGDGNISNDQHPSQSYANAGDYDITLIVEDANGCKSDLTVIDALGIRLPFVLDFETVAPFDATSTCKDSLQTQFRPLLDLATDGPYGFSWNFGDGNTSPQFSPTNTFNTNGQFDVQLTAFNAYCTATVTKPQFITIEPLQPSFAIGNTSGCSPLDVAFTNTSAVINDKTTATWVFGNGASLTDKSDVIQNHTQTYPSAGVFTPMLIMTSELGDCIDTAYNGTVTVSDPLVVNFASDIQNSCDITTPITFTPNIAGAFSYLWDFGDGTTLSLENPTHVYNLADTFDVTLTITDPFGCTSPVTKLDYIKLHPPTALFTSDMLTNVTEPPLWNGFPDTMITGGCLPLDITFTDLSTSVTPIVDYSWTFGDGNVLAGMNANPTNTYVTEGNFPVSLTITTIDGCTDTFVCDSCAETGAKPDALLDITGYPLHQCCDAETVHPNLTIAGTADFFWYETTSGESYGVPYTAGGDMNWDYQQKHELVDSAGFFISTRLFAYNHGCIDTFDLIDWVELHNPYVEPFVIFPPCYREDSIRIDSVLLYGRADSVRWDFSYLNQFSDTLHPNFALPNGGSHNLNVEVWDLTNKWPLSNGDTVCSCANDVTIDFPVRQVFGFTSDVTTGCLNLVTTFSALDVFDTYLWDFGNGQTSTDANPSVTYTSAGSYTVKLITTDAQGCSDTITKTNFINAFGVEAYIDTTDFSGCLPLPISLKDTSQLGAPMQSRLWTIEHYNVTATTLELTFTFDTLPPYPYLQTDGILITLVVTDINGCVNSDSVRVFPSKPLAYFTHNDSIHCANDSIAFIPTLKDSTGIAPFSYLWLMDSVNNVTSTASAPHILFTTNDTYKSLLILEDANGCKDTSATQEIVVNIKQPQVGFSLTPAIGTCTPHLVSFTDTTVLGRSPLATWEWDFGDGTTAKVQHPEKIYTVEGSFAISLTITDSLGCTSTITPPDGVAISGITGGFTIDNKVICNYNYVTFYAFSPNGKHFNWDFGDGTVSFGDTVTHLYTEAGTRFPKLVIQDSLRLCDNSFTDTITIIPTPEPLMPKDTSICIGETATIGTPLDSLLYLWSTGETTQFINVSIADTYRVLMTDTVTGCINTDSTTLHLISLPNSDLPDSLLICINQSTKLAPKLDKTGKTYSWEENALEFATTPTVTVLVDAQKQIVFAYTDTDNCSNKDTIQVIPLAPPIDEGELFQKCFDELITIDGNKNNILDVNATYQWYVNGNLFSQNQVITVSQPDETYTLKYTQDGCQYELKNNTHYHPLPLPTNPEPQYFCKEFDGSVNLIFNGYAKYYWVEFNDSTNNVIADDEGIYHVFLGNEFNCFVPDSLDVRDVCPPRLFVGNAFSPNGDATNDGFDVKTRYLDVYNITIFNRWGEIIFYSEDPNNSWDGTYRGNTVAVGVYPWLIQYNGEHPRP